MAVAGLNNQLREENFEVSFMNKKVIIRLDSGYKEDTDAIDDSNL